jgi:hypothetical protein
LFRRAALAVAAVLAVVLVAGCQTHPGTAAYVGDHRITTADVDRTVAANAQGPREQAVQNALNVLIQTELMRSVAEQTHTPVTPAFLAGAKEDPELQAQAGQLGVAPEAFATFAGYFVSVQNALVRQLGGAAGQVTEAEVAQVQARLVALRAEAAKRRPVTVNPRYGAFDPERALVQPVVEPGIKQLSRS